MPRVDLLVETPISQSARAKQLSAMFDVPPQASASIEWHGDLPLEAKEWSVGLLVGPSGAGKSTVLRQVFGGSPQIAWGQRSVIDDFRDDLRMDDIAAACQAVGFNTIPAWLRPYDVLSMGEKFRVELARRLLESDDMIVMDEFTSVVDRQVAKIGAHAVQKAVRKRGQKFVAASCHYDIIDWLQPDWTLEPATMTFQWRSVQRRPAIEVELRRVAYSTWQLFAPFHYLTRDLHPGSTCWALFVEGEPAAFAAVNHRPHPKVKGIHGISRGVTLPDWQGLGLMMLLISELGALYRAVGFELRSYPAHPGWVRSHDRSPLWRMDKRPGVYSSRTDGPNAELGKRFGGRPNAVFTYVGPAADDVEAQRAFA